MFFKQYFLGCLAHASYMVADEKTHTAIVVDPRRDIDEYVEDAEREGFAIRHTLLTHVHADFVAGHLELRDRFGVEVHLGARAQADYPFTPMADGSVLEFGDVRLQVLETPGHTPEGISVLVFDLAKDAGNPEAVLTGDTLFIGDVGRPDLMASIGVSAEELASMLYDSLRTKLMPLPDETIVYPAHGAGSLCGRNLSTDTSSTMGVQKLYNHALQPMTKQHFVELVTTDLPPAPAYFAYDADLNRREHATLTTTVEQALNPLGLDEVLRLRDEGAQLIDVRDPSDYAGAHLSGSVSIGLGGSFATWAGVVLDPAIAIVIVADPGTEAEATTRLGRIGFDNVAGYLDGGMLALSERPDLVSRVVRATAPSVDEMLGGPQPPAVLDVRAPEEWESGHIEGSLNVPLNEIKDRMGELTPTARYVVHCASGYRSAIAASLLTNAGFDSVVELVGGFKAWQASGLPVAG